MRDMAQVVGIDLPQKMIDYEAFMDLARGKVRRLQTKIEMLMSQREPYKPVTSYELTQENQQQIDHIRNEPTQRKQIPSLAILSRNQPEQVEEPVKSPFSLVDSATHGQHQTRSYALQSLASERLIRPTDALSQRESHFTDPPYQQ